MKYQKHAFALGFLSCFIMLSCVPNKKLVYFQNLPGNTPIEAGELINYQMPDYQLQHNDILEVQVITHKDIIADDFNIGKQGLNQNSMMVGQIAQTGGDIYYTTGYTINKEGNITLPVLGDVYVKGMTLDEVTLSLTDKFSSMLLNNYFIKVKLGGMRFSALGEFQKPGKYGMLQDRMTIFDAISQAGDLTTVAKRSELILIRQYPEGSRKHHVNLNDINLISSPFYFIQPNDLLYVEPMKIRELGSGINATQTLTLITSSITAIALVLNLINN
ncbi:polysaccharide biosynthesis/export family protein [Belliella marina]|uniref:Polysaccharide biosynthesis/export family protein n=1 Tax=Belliella marina TaxID=1644146 RepID=A0ABW4VP42_9BACT